VRFFKFNTGIIEILLYETSHFYKFIRGSIISKFVILHFYKVVFLIFSGYLKWGKFMTPYGQMIFTVYKLSVENACFTN